MCDSIEAYGMFAMNRGMPQTNHRSRCRTLEYYRSMNGSDVLYHHCTSVDNQGSCVNIGRNQAAPLLVGFIARSPLQKELSFDFCREEKGTSGVESRNTLGRVHFEVFICQDQGSCNSSSHFRVCSVHLRPEQRPICESSNQRTEPNLGSHHSSATKHPGRAN